MWEMLFGGGLGSVMRWVVGCVEGVARSAEGVCVCVCVYVYVCVCVLGGLWESGLGLGVFLCGWELGVWNCCEVG